MKHSVHERGDCVVVSIESTEPYGAHWEAIAVENELRSRGATNVERRSDAATAVITVRGLPCLAVAMITTSTITPTTPE